MTAAPGGKTLNLSLSLATPMVATVVDPSPSRA